MDLYRSDCVGGGGGEGGFCGLEDLYNVVMDFISL